MMAGRLPRALTLLLFSLATGFGAERVLDSGRHHLRFGNQREWADFPERAEAAELNLEFSAAPTSGETTLRVRHRDIKQRWSIELNGRSLATLPVDENEMVTYWGIPAGTLKAAGNRLRIFGAGKEADDIYIGDIRIDDRPRSEVLHESRLEVRVFDTDSGTSLPSRITLLDEQGSLATTGAVSNATLAVRPGIVYTADGRAALPVPVGKYRVFAGHGFEYSTASAEAELKVGETKMLELSIRREVPTDGWAACDTHCHTFTHSRHGDATIEERMITIAAEGIELPVAADHNLQIDYGPTAKTLDVRRYFTPITGNEVTTAVGHFNVFPLEPGPTSIDHKGKDWAAVFDSIFAEGRKPLVVLNHARDIHGGYRPFDPRRHIAVAGERLDGDRLQANLMEIVNSGTTQTDGLQLFEDWTGLVNRGLKIAPVGSSDSHDVARHFVGQGRTYVRCDDHRPGEINLDEVYRNLRAGRVLVSFGLLADLNVDGRYGPGDMAPAGDSLRIAARVLGPQWTQARKMTLYSNGVPIREVEIDPKSTGSALGVKWEGEWALDRPKHDVFLAAMATGPGIRELYWPTPKPYQPTSSEWAPYVLGATGAIFIDADGDGRFTSAHGYAEQLVKKHGSDLDAIAQSLATYDEAVAVQTASILARRGDSPLDDTVQAALKSAAPQVRRGFGRYVDAWKQSQQARLEPEK